MDVEDRAESSQAVSASEPVDTDGVDASLRDFGLEGLVLLAQFHGIPADAAQVRHAAGLGDQLLDELSLLKAARSLGLKAQVVPQPLERLDRISLPALALRDDGRAFILAKVDNAGALIHDPHVGRPKIIGQDELKSRYERRLLVVASRASAAATLGKFDFTWFVPSVIKYRKLLLETLFVSLLIQLLALITPLFFQVVMDKVLANQAMTTLNVITVGLAIIAIFNCLLTGLRSYVFAHTTSRIDVELGSQLFRHLLSLPMAWFESRRVGETIARVRELENIRSFLTGQALTSVLDLLFTVVFLGVMFIYSGWLTLAVAISLPVYAIWSALLSPRIRARLNEKFARSADNQSFLVEAVTGIGTVKSMAVEPRMARAWDNQLAGYVRSGFRVSQLANIGQQGVQFIQRSVSVALLYFGARLVVSGDMSIGQLVAFNMLAGQVASPVIRLAQLWQDFQQVGISVARLGDVLNAKTEIARSQLNPPPIVGQIRIDSVSFRYRPDSPLVLDDVSIDIPAGRVLGIVGRSGSGKSSLTRLIQRLYVPERGRILVDGIDLSLADTAWLRRQLGVVLQENFLFNRSIRDNIALGDSALPLSHVIEASKLAGAHEFIINFPEGYDTIVGEHGSTLSGGQRQRIAIARALIGNPRVLIFDEATSALDYESEKIVMDNMRDICRGRTVLIIAHRLSTVRHADQIIVMEQGRVVEMGTPRELITKPNGHFARLHELQQG